MLSLLAEYQLVAERYHRACRFHHESFEACREKTCVHARQIIADHPGGEQAEQPNDVLEVENEPTIL